MKITKCISMATPSHEILERDWFRPSFKDNCPLEVFHSGKVERCNGLWGSASFNTAIYDKTKFIMQQVARHQGEMLLWADVDIQFFEPVLPKLEALMGDNDMIFQKDCHLFHEICAGFFVTRCTKKTLLFWYLAYLLVSTKKFLIWVTRGKFLYQYINIMNDQRAVNLLLGIFAKPPIGKKRRNLFGIKWEYLPDIFYCPGVNYSQIWKPGDHLNLPENIVIHHANWTLGIEHKIAQLEYVRDVIKQRKAAAQ